MGTHSSSPSLPPRCFLLGSLSYWCPSYALFPTFLSLLSLPASHPLSALSSPVCLGRSPVPCLASLPGSPSAVLSRLHPHPYPHPPVQALIRWSSEVECPGSGLRGRGQT